MIRVRILRATGAGALGVLGVGERITLPDADARALIGAGRAEAILMDPDAPADGAPVPRSADPKPKRTR